MSMIRIKTKFLPALFGAALVALIPTAQAEDTEFHVFYDPMQAPVTNWQMAAFSPAPHRGPSWQDSALPWGNNSLKVNAEPAAPAPAPVLDDLSLAALNPAGDADEQQDPFLTAEDYSPIEEGALFIASPVADSTLDETRGAGASFTGADVIGAAIFNGSINKSNVNIEGEATTGSNSLNDNVLTNTSGVVSLIQNSGSNVVIQHATVVNLQIKND